MDGNMGLIMASGLASLAVQGVGCYSRKRKASKLYKMKLSSLIMSKGCGKTQLKDSLASLASDLVIVDMNTAVLGTDRLDYLKKGKEYVDDLLKKFPKKKFLLLLSSKEESDYFGVDKLNSFIICPSIDLFRSILGDIDVSLPGNRAKVHLMEKERLSLIKDTDSEQLNIFSTFDELYSVIKTVYKLQSSF